MRSHFALILQCYYLKGEVPSIFKVLLCDFSAPVLAKEDNETTPSKLQPPAVQRLQSVPAEARPSPDVARRGLFR